MTNPWLGFIVTGKPVSQGSKDYHAVRAKDGTVTPVGVESAGAALTAWRSDVRQAAREELQTWGAAGELLWDAALTVRMIFTFARPKTHFRTGRFSSRLRDDAPQYYTRAPDGDKLVRAVLDALTHVVYADDSQVVDCLMSKRYGTVSGVSVRVGMADQSITTRHGIAPGSPTQIGNLDL